MGANKPMDANKLWVSTQQHLKASFSKATFELYFYSAKPVAIENNVLYLSGSIQDKEFFEKQNKKELLKAFNYLAVNITDVIVLTNDSDLNSVKNNLSYSHDGDRIMESEKKDKIMSLSKSIASANLNPKYTFDTFVVGPSNNLAVAACQRVADYDGTLNDNPLFLYGGVGLGKTHLMHAIGHRILERDPSKKILYVSSETFTNEFIVALKEKKNEEFRQKYRNVDIFMIDDVQFIAGKDIVQEELFHTFNDVHAAGSKIILSSDRPPKDIQKLEERVRSRFAWGLMADIQPPDYGTRMAILQTKAEIDKLSVPKDVTEYIADNIMSNIRELEGALNKVVVFSELISKDITLELAKEALKDVLISYKTNEINLLRIKETVADYYNISVDE